MARKIRMRKEENVSNLIKNMGIISNNTWIDYNDIEKGGILIFKMNDKPNKYFWVSPSSRPFSLTNINQVIKKTD